MNTGTPIKDAEEFLSGKLAQVNVARIETELAALWKKAAHGDATSAAGNLVRACSFNLILMTDAEDAESTCSDLLDEIEQHHPCRSLLAIFRPKKAHQLNAWVSARCHIMGSSKQICSEQITVCCDGGKPEELASVVLPLVLPDLPVFIWWRKQTLERNELNALHASANRLILDSGLNPFESQIFSDASKLINDSKERLFVSDLNWRSLQGWCRAIADSFDGFPMTVDSLQRITRITIQYAGEAAISNRALLLASWFASRLGWEPVSFSEKDRIAVFKTGKRQVQVLFGKSSSGTRPGQLFEVEIAFVTGSNGASSSQVLIVAPEDTDEARFIIARLEGTEQKESTRISSIVSESVLVGQELEVLADDPIYEASTHMAAQLLGLRK